MLNLTGIHHLTAVSAKIRENYRFYTQVLGMRLVKRSVNQDDVSASGWSMTGGRVMSPRRGSVAPCRPLISFGV